jgi:hypothetical protein
MLTGHMAFLANLTADPDAMLVDGGYGYPYPSVAVALSIQAIALRKFFTYDEIVALQASASAPGDS